MFLNKYFKAAPIALMLPILIGSFAGTRSGASSLTMGNGARYAASEGCGTHSPKVVGPNGIFEGVSALARSGVTKQDILRSVPTNTVASWCAYSVSIGQSNVRRMSVIVKFLAKATQVDEQRAAAYFRHTNLFSSVTIYKNRHYY